MSLFDVDSEEVIENPKKAFQEPWPQPHAELCPVCMGKGVIPEGTSSKECHGCLGKGWVTVA